MEVNHIAEKKGIFRERVRKLKVPEKAYFSSGQHPEEQQRRRRMKSYII